MHLCSFIYQSHCWIFTNQLILWNQVSSHNHPGTTSIPEDYYFLTVNGTWGCWQPWLQNVANPFLVFHIWMQGIICFTLVNRLCTVIGPLLSLYLTKLGLGGSVGCAVRLETRRSRVQPPPRSATFFRGDWSWNIFYGHSLPSADSRRAVVSFWRKNVHNTG